MAEQKGSSDRHPSGRIELLGLKPDDTRPEMAVYAVDRAFKTIAKTKVLKDGTFRLAPKALEKADLVVIGPQVDDLSQVERKRLMQFRAARFQEILETNGVFDIPRTDWIVWPLFRVCVDGSVEHCRLVPPFINDLLRQAAFELPNVAASINTNEALPVRANLSDAQIAQSSILLPFPWRRRCETVCDGLVEVYRRVCCCRPLVLYDPRIDDLLDDLGRILPEVPEIRWPPRPEPDPPPFAELPFFRDGALDQRMLNARRDLQVLRSLSPSQQVEYINARPYLYCSCGDATKVAEGFIRADGKFHICWDQYLFLLFPNCRVEYAYVVKQEIDGSHVTIYDGVAANQWYEPGEFAELTSYHPQAQGCRENSFPDEDGAFVVLQDIGDAGSFRLKTPDASGWDRVNSPAYNDGMADPAPNAAAAVGKLLDRVWGGTLKLRYFFSEEMRDIGARYYRVSVVAADGNGNPTGPRSYLAPGGLWKYYASSGAGFSTEKMALGPHTVGGQSDLYLIPFDADRAWHSGQYHASLPTKDHSNRRYLLTIEVFDASGHWLRPNGTPNPGGTTTANFRFLRWFQETGPMADVPFAALTHMFWWDNRPAEAKIVDLRVDGSENTEECQFLEGPASTNFSIGYRAYHPNPLVQLNHRIWWRRGLGGPSDYLTSPDPNPFNVGVPPAAPHPSGSQSFSHMLAGLDDPKCSFSVNLHVNVKTFDGEVTLTGYNDWDQAAFALEIV